MMDKPENTFKSVIEEFSLPCLCETLEIFKHVDLSQFAPAKLSETLSSQLLKWRIGKRQSSELQWEPSCSYQKASVCQVIEWNSITNCKTPTESQKESQDILKACCPEHYWCYSDYNYMKDIFPGSPLLGDLKWKELGFDNKTGHDSTMWIGTAGAHTLCHYDTYGYNLVIQISGSKRWVLFPPSDMDSLYPTRIPYEESTVFSEVNLGNPDLSRHPEFCKAKACTVALRPGDILYVPRHWWHYVENLELSVSINLWYDMNSHTDAGDRLTESVTRLIVGAMARAIPKEEAWISSTEDLASVTSVEESFKFLVESLQESSTVAEYHPPSDGSNSHRIIHRDSNPILIKPLSLVNFMENGYFKFIQTVAKNQRSTCHDKNEMDTVDVMKCFTHPKVMNCLANVIQNRFNGIVCASSYADESMESLCDNTSCDRTSSTSMLISPKEDNRRLSGNLSDHEGFSNEDCDNCTEDTDETGLFGCKSDHFDDVWQTKIDSTAATNLPLVSISKVPDFEARLKRKDCNLMNLMKFDNASSLENYFDLVMPKLFSENLMELCGTTSRASTFPRNDEVVCAMHEALQGNPTLKSSNETLIGRRMRVWLSGRKRKIRDHRHNMLRPHSTPTPKIRKLKYKNTG